MLSNTANLRVGRLLEIRANSGYRTVADVDELFDAIGRQVAQLPDDEPHITVVDWRRCPVMSPEAAQRIAARIAATNDRTERSAALAAANAPVAVLQFVRLIREAGLETRRLFFDAAELVEWLEKCLTTAETERLKAFLSEDSAVHK